MNNEFRDRSDVVRAAIRKAGRSVALWIGLGIFALGLLHAQKPFKEYPSIEHTGYHLPADWDRPAEWVFARLKYPDIERFYRSDSVYWTMDYPAGDRHIVDALRRLTRIDARSVEQVVELDGSDDVYNWPFLYAVEVGYWDPTTDEAQQLRDYLDRGGFLMVDDFHGPPEWENFKYVMSLVFPDRDIRDLAPNHTIFHVMADVDQLVQVPAAQYIISGETWEKGGRIPHWRGIVDDKGRVVVAIDHNMDLGDSVEWADDPRYPEEFAAIGFRIFTNYVTYDLTH